MSKQSNKKQQPAKTGQANQASRPSQAQQSEVARRREQVRQQQEQQAKTNRIMQAVAAVGAIIILALLGWQLLANRNETTTTASDGSGCDPANLMAADRALAETAPAGRNNFFTSYPDMVIQDGQSYEALIQTAKGDICLKLFTQESPLAANNFVFLANQGFYDGVTFHRVLEGFMAQGGDPTGTGSGGPGYAFANETDNGLVFDRAGLLAMANAGPDTNGSQFFITFVPTEQLNGGYTIFGEVISGSEVLSQITRRDPTQPDQPAGDIIERIDIFAHGS